MEQTSPDHDYSPGMETMHETENRVLDVLAEFLRWVLATSPPNIALVRSSTI